MPTLYNHGSYAPGNDLIKNPHFLQQIPHRYLVYPVAFPSH